MASTKKISSTERTGRWLSGSVASPDSGVAAQMARVFGYVKGLHATHLIDIGVMLGLFEELARRERGAWPDALAKERGLQRRYVQIWCEAACALELLDYESEHGYSLAPGMDEVLGKPDGSSYIGAFPAAHLEVARDYERYDELFRSGGVHPFEAHDETFLRAVAAATQVLPRMFLDGVLPGLPALRHSLEAGARVLDVGCGAGYAMVELAHRFPAVRCVGVDRDPVSVGMAAELAIRQGVEDRVEARAFDATGLTGDFADQFDLVTMFLVLHEVTPADKPAVLRECRRALHPGGRLLIFDECYPGGPSELRDQTQIYAVIAQWYEATWGNVIDDRDGIRALIEDAGFEIEDEAELSRFFIVTAQARA